MWGSTLRNIFVLPVFQSSSPVSTVSQMLSQHFSLLSCWSKNNHHTNTAREVEKNGCQRDQNDNFKTSNLLSWDHRGKFSGGRGSDLETLRTCSVRDIPLSGSWWSPSYRSNGADACTALCQTAETQRDVIWLTCAKLPHSFLLQIQTGFNLGECSFIFLTMGFLKSFGLMQRMKYGWHTVRVFIRDSRDWRNWPVRVGTRFLLSAACCQTQTNATQCK